jgi:hypothetical protein
LRSYKTTNGFASVGRAYLRCCCQYRTRYFHWLSSNQATTHFMGMICIAATNFRALAPLPRKSSLFRVALASSTGGAAILPLASTFVNGASLRLFPLSGRLVFQTLHLVHVRRDFAARMAKGVEGLKAVSDNVCLLRLTKLCLFLVLGSKRLDIQVA